MNKELRHIYRVKSSDFNEEASLLQNDKAIRLLLNLIDFNILDGKYLYSNSEELSYLMNKGFIIKSSNKYYLSNKGLEFLELIGIEKEKLTRNDQEHSQKGIINYYDIKNIEEETIINDINKLSNRVIEVKSEDKILELKVVVNCISNLNKLFITLNKKLQSDWRISIIYQTNEQRKKYYYIKNTFWRKILYKFFNNFSINKILFKNYNRFLAKPELLGRLYYCGFDVVDYQGTDKYDRIIVIKKFDKDSETEKKYGLVTKLPRIGQNGKIIYLYKFRTMYPYAEELQDFKLQVYMKELKSKDYSIPKWGRLLRKYWLDELPMIVNFIRGDLKLVGVRPLGETYLELYPKDFVKRRLNYKPGIIPPYYADFPKSLFEIVKSEESYLNQYDKNPIKTDIKYLFRIYKNLLFSNSK